ncbi:MAG TPA: ABC-F family ATP-binding cassette domain-containing protein, partial [Phycisphaeraceae bacterium]|nr:ABC-F family ATP-binding cassette domain-containing protein [Phycisphaeraceae bacterium]
MALLSCANISHSFGTRIILDGVSFAVEQGERVGLVGRNGCGKTTLMKIIAGSLTPDQGDIHKQRSARFGYLAQDPELEPGETLKGA